VVLIYTVFYELLIEFLLSKPDPNLFKVIGIQFKRNIFIQSN